MKVRHQMGFRCKCPVDGKVDYYVASFYVRRLLKCEDIAQAVAALTREAAYQECLTQALANRLDCKVKTVVRHRAGEGVITTVVCRQAPGTSEVTHGPQADGEAEG